MTPELIGVLLYLAAQFAIGAWVARRVRSQSDYLLAGRSIGPFLATFSIFATWFGAETCIGSSARIYTDGLSGGRADPFGYTICLVLMGLLLARPLWKRGITTLGDLYRTRYGAAVEKLAVLVMIPTSLMWAAAQLKAFSAVLGSVAGLPRDTTLAIGALVVIAYTTIGGLKADIITDLVQGIAVIIGLAILLVAGISAAGGLDAGLASIEPARLSLVGEGESLLARIDEWLVPIIGSLVAQEMISRMLACRSAGTARASTFAGAGIYLVVGVIPVVLALLGPVLAPDLADPEQFLSHAARLHLPTLLFVLFSGALISAILSTVDSALLAIGSFVSQNLVRARPDDPERHRELRAARLTVVAAGVAAYGIARFGGSIYDLVEQASTFGSAGIVVISAFALRGRFGGPSAAIAAIAAGLVVKPLAEYRGLDAPYLATLGAAAIAYLAVAALGGSRPSPGGPAGGDALHPAAPVR